MDCLYLFFNYSDVFLDDPVEVVVAAVCVLVFNG